MKTDLCIRTLCLILALSVVCLCTGCGQKEEKRDRQSIVEELVVDYGSYGGEADERVQSLLKELRAAAAGDEQEGPARAVPGLLTPVIEGGGGAVTLPIKAGEQ